MEKTTRKIRHQLRAERKREIDLEKTLHTQRLRAQLRALDRILGSVPLEQRNGLKVHDALTEAPDTEKPGPLREIVYNTPRAELIPRILVDIYDASLENRTYQNVYRHSDPTKSRDPTCSEVLRLLPNLDSLLQLSLSIKFEAITNNVKPFKFLNLPAEIRVHVYSFLVPQTPYLRIIDLRQPSNPYRLPRYSLVPFRTCRKVHDELTEHFYSHTALVWNIFEIVRGGEWHESNCARDLSIVNGMRPKTREYFKNMEIRLHTCSDRDTKLCGAHWEASHIAPWRTMFDWTLKAFPNLEVITVCFEIGYNYIGSYKYFAKALDEALEFLLSRIPRSIRLQWDFRITSDQKLLRRLKEVPIDTERGTLDSAKHLIREEMARRGTELVEAKGVGQWKAPRVKGYGLPSPRQKK